MIPSRYNFSVTKCHTVATRWLCEGLAKSCSHRKTIGKHRVSIVLSSCGVKGRCRRWPHEVKTMATRTNRMSTRWPHDGREGLTKSTRRCTFGKTFGNFLTCQRFYEHSRSCSRTPKKLGRRSHDGLGCSPEWPDVFHDHSRCCKFPPSCVHRGAKIGTVWRQHNDLMYLIQL